MGMDSSSLMSTDIRHVVSTTPIAHELTSTLYFSVDASVVQLAKEIRRCIIAGLVCWTVVAVTRSIVGIKRYRLERGIRIDRQRGEIRDEPEPQTKAQEN